MKDLAVSLLALPYPTSSIRPVFTDVLAALRKSFEADAAALYRPSIATSASASVPTVVAVHAASSALAARVRAALKRGADPEASAVTRVQLHDGSVVALVHTNAIASISSAASKRLAALPALASTLTKRLAAEQVLRDGVTPFESAAALLDAMPTAAFLADGEGALVHANAAGHASLATGGAALAKRVASAAASGGARGLNVVPLGAEASALRAVLVTEKRAGAPQARLESFARENELTPRQIEVLRELLRGSSNRVIAESLACAEVTVEVHVSALLRKGKVKSRAALLAKLWAGA